jgi:hypothetical protein|tara:strand:+ start:675 stop:1076 length:402 start_codon:yes stop_codon:yes gene_type:complete
MSVHKYSSWGRTRRPKAASGKDGDLITGSSGLSALNALAVGSFNAENGCYRTENQRYAHIACSGSSTVSNVYTYNYAMGFWHELKRFDFSTGTDRESIVVGNDEHLIIDINGADWISIKSGSNSVVTMAFSTF